MMKRVWRWSSVVLISLAIYDSENFEFCRFHISLFSTEVALHTKLLLHSGERNNARSCPVVPPGGRMSEVQGSGRCFRYFKLQLSGTVGK